MSSIPTEIEEQTIQENGPLSGPPNPMAQQRRYSSAKTPSGLGLVLGVIAVGLVLALGSVFGLWLLRSVRRLNRQVAHLSRQTEQLNRRIQGAEQQATALAQQASQAAADAQAAALQRDQAKESQVKPAAEAASAVHTAAAQQPPNHAGQKAEETRKPREQELQTLQQSLAQIAETHRSSNGMVMTLGEKSLRFDSGKWDIAPRYRTMLKRIAGLLVPLKGYSIYIYGYTDDTGTKDANLKLSGRRARAVRDSLVQAGIDPSLISAKGFGKSDPRVRGNNPTARAANRRVEIGIVDTTLPSSAQGKLKRTSTPR
jgi:outer membrane protein OmpA-like peptidoglycan-associated protein